MKPAVTVDHLWKRYHKRFGTSTLWSLFGRRERTDDEFWALKDVSFEVQPGECLGIIGPNGSGKSTLLKILSRITTPTRGKITVNGRVASLLEVGTGFHPELTGRENIFLSGAILGMKKADIRKRFDEIIAFSGVEEFIDVPVKRYSSGMYVRLAFAVAAHIETDVLIVDEVLAVGDAAFQKKCLGTMGDVARRGRTVLFVSHNMPAIQHLCGMGIVLQKGKVAYCGNATDAVSEYVQGFASETGDLAEARIRDGDGRLRVTRIEMRDTAGHHLESVLSGQDIELVMNYECSSPVRGAVFSSLLLKTQFDVPVFLQHNRLSRTEFRGIPLRGRFVCRLKHLPLPPGSYVLAYSVREESEVLDAHPVAKRIEVVGGDFHGCGEVPEQSHGLCLVEGAWRLEQAEAGSK